MALHTMPTGWRQQDNPQTQQIFHGLHHQQMLQTRRESPGFQHLYSLPHPTVQLRCFETSAGQQTAYIKPNFTGHFSQDLISNNNTGWQQRQHSSCAFSAGTSSPALQRGALGVSAQGHHSSLDGKLLTEAPILRTLQLQDTRYSSLEQTHAIVETEPPTDDQIQDFIKENVNYFVTQKSNIADHPHHSTTSASDKEDRHTVLHAEQRTAAVGRAPQKDSSKGSNTNAEFTVKSKATGDCPTVASDKYSTGTILTAIGNSEQMYLHQPLSVDNDTSVDFNYPGKMHLDVIMPTNAVCKLVHSYYTEDRKIAGSNNESFQSQLGDKYSQNGKANLYYSLTALRELVASLDKVETVAKRDNFSKLILQQYWNGDIGNLRLFTSTEYPQIMAKVATTCTKSEDENPLVVQVSKITWRALTEKDPSLMLNCSSSKGEETSHWWNINSSSVEMDRESQMALKQMTQKEKGDTDLKSVEAVELDNVQGATVSEDLQTKSRSVVTADKTLVLTSLNCENEDINKNRKRDTEDKHCPLNCEEAIAHSKQKSSVNLTHNVISVRTDQSKLHEDVMKKAGSGSSQTDSSQTLSKKIPNPSLSTESRGEEACICKDPQYDDISDEDMQYQLTNLPNTEHKKSNFTPCFEEPQYEDPSEDGNQQIEETPSLTQAGESNCKQSSLKNEVHRCVLGQTQMETEITSDEKLITKEQISPKTGTLDEAQHYTCACSGETDDPLCPKCDRERHLGLDTNHSASCSPSSILIDEDDTDDEMEDDYIVIPISLTGIQFEAEDKAHDVQEVVVLSDDESGDEDRHSDTILTCSDLHCPVPNPEPASACSKLEVFDTLPCFMKAKCIQFGLVLESDSTTPDHEVQSKGEQYTHKTRREPTPEPEDSCETEDSCDYSSASEHNYMTVPKHMLKKRSKPLPSDTDDSESDQESKDDETRNAQKDEVRTTSKLNLSKLAAFVARSKLVRPRTQIKESTKKKDIIIVDSETDDESDQNRRMEAAFRKNRVPTTSSPAPQHQPELLKGPSEHVKHETNKKKSSNKEEISHSYAEDDRLTTSKRIVSHGSSKVVNNHNQMSKKKNMTTVSPVSKDDGSASIAIQKRPTSEATNHLYGPVKKKLKKNVSLSYNSPKKQPQSPEKVAGSISRPNPGITHIFVEKSSLSSKCLKLSKGSDFQRQTPKTLPATSKISDSCENNTQHSLRNEQEKVGPKLKHTNDRHFAANKLQTNVTKPTLISRQPSLPCPSTSSSSSTTTGGQHPEARRSSELSRSGEKTASSRPPKTMQSTSLPRRHSSPTRQKRSDSLCTPSTLDHPSTTKRPSSNASTQSSWEKMRKKWRDNYVPTRRDKKRSLGTEKALRTTCSESRMEVRSRPTSRHNEKAYRQRHSSQESATPLMKRSKMEARELTKARNREIIRGPRLHE